MPDLECVHIYAAKCLFGRSILWPKYTYVPYAEDDRKQPTCRNCLKQMQSKAGVEITMLMRGVFVSA